MKFIHLADTHISAEPEGKTPLGVLRKQEIWDAFADIIALCEREQIELLLIAGDLFHGQPSLQDVKKADKLFRELTKTKVVLIAGNHDCLLPDSHYYDVAFPEHVVFLMDAQGGSVYFPELNVEVFGLSYEKPRIAEARYDALHPTDASRINILLAHGNTSGGDGSIPIHREAIEAAGFDYAALGHVHTRRDVSERIRYTGSFEPLERKEIGERGYIAGTMEKTGKELAKVVSWFVPHAKRLYLSVEVPVMPDMDGQEVAERILAAQREGGMQHMYLVTLTGRRSRRFLPEELQESLSTATSENAASPENIVSSGNVAISENAALSGNTISLGNVAISENAALSGNTVSLGNAAISENATSPEKLKLEGYVLEIRDKTVPDFNS